MKKTAKFEKDKIIITTNETTNLDKQDITKRLEAIQRHKERLVMENKRIVEDYNILGLEENELKEYLLQFPVEPLIKL